MEFSYLSVDVLVELFRESEFYQLEGLSSILKRLICAKNTDSQSVFLTTQHLTTLKG